MTRLSAETLDAFVPLTNQLEGRVNYMYQDSAGWVTTAAGVKIDPLTADIVTLPWKIGERDAAPEEIKACWATVKANRNPAYTSTGAEQMPGNVCRLPDAARDNLTSSKLAWMADAIVSQLPDAADWPSDGQLGLLAILWATGPGILTNPPDYLATLVDALQAGDFAKAGKLAKWKNINPDRRQALVTLFANAAIAAKTGTTALNYPNAATDTAITGEEDMAFIDEAFAGSFGDDAPPGTFGNSANAPKSGVTQTITSNLLGAPDESDDISTLSGPTGPSTPVQSAADALLDALPITSGPLVSAFQSAYNAAGGNPALAVDGAWGPNTSAALSKYGDVPSAAPATPHAATTGAPTPHAATPHAASVATPHAAPILSAPQSWTAPGAGKWFLFAGVVGAIAIWAAKTKR